MDTEEEFIKAWNAGKVRRISDGAKPWVGLTNEERDDIWNRYCDEMGEASINDAPDIVQAIEQALKEKNHEKNT